MSTPQETWAAVDQYVAETTVASDGVLDAALADAAAGGLPAIQVPAAHGKMLYLLAKMIGAKRILEVGTLGGYSTLWLGRAVAGQRISADGEQGGAGEVVTLELNPHHAEIARKNIERAGLASTVKIVLGKAAETLPHLAGVFDLIFIDADKQSIPTYYDWALKLSRPGTVIVVDNVIRAGNVIDAGTPDVNIQGVRRFNEILKKDTRVEATTIQTVGGKGYDGFTMIRVK